jgi:hypothetical protein
MPATLATAFGLDARQYWPCRHWNNPFGLFQFADQGGKNHDARNRNHRQNSVLLNCTAKSRDRHSRDRGVFDRGLAGTANSGVITSPRRRRELHKSWRAYFRPYDIETGLWLSNRLRPYGATA